MSYLDAIKNVGIPTGDSWNTSTDGNGDIFSDTKGYKSVDPATKPGIAEADGGPGIYADNTGNGQYSSGAGNVGRWDVAQSIREFFDSAFGTSLNAKVLPPHNREWIG